MESKMTTDDMPLSISDQGIVSSLSLDTEFSSDYSTQHPHTMNAQTGCSSHDSAIEAEEGTDIFFSSEETDTISLLEVEDTDPRAARKAAKKLAKAQRRAKREGRADESVGQKSCDTCSKSVNLLIRCQVDESKAWKMVCGKCWNGVSGGTVDGDTNHPHYKYGGLWKNRK